VVGTDFKVARECIEAHCSEAGWRHGTATDR